MNYWFTSDYHLGHKNIIAYCNRPFKSLQHMNETIIKNHNARVKPEDIVFHIGDFCFRNTSNKGEGIRINSLEWEQRLNGKIIHIKGNHDKNNSTKAIISGCIINHCGQKCFLTHRPEDYCKDFKYNLVGHIHEKWKIKRINKNILINVGVDVWGFRPHTLQELFNATRN